MISQSGWGVLTSWDNNIHCNIPDYYEKICGVLTGENNKTLGALQENDFSSWQPDIIVVNLGTNDGGAFNAPEWKDALTGEAHKQRLNEDGSQNEEDIRAFEGAVIGFLKKLRKYNKKAHIVWAYGMLGSLMAPAIKHAIKAYIEETGDIKVTFLLLSDTTEETKGARSHPGLPAHQKAAEELTAYIAAILKQQ